MYNLAVIFESSPFDMKGQFNAVHNRVKNLVATGRCKVDVYCLHSRDNAFTRKVRKTMKVPHKKTVVVEGIEYRMLWYRFSIIDFILAEKLHRKSWIFDRFIHRNVVKFKGYDMILAHSYEGAYMAKRVKDIFGVPYHVTWHGSDVHTHPVRNPFILRMTRIFMEAAECNVFVSRSLMAASVMITEDAPKAVLYNGVSERFFRYPEDKRAALRRHYGLNEDEKVVAYVGNFLKVKNVEVLPDLFHKIHEDFDLLMTEEKRDDISLKFWIIGDGKLRPGLEPLIRKAAGAEVVFWGNRPADEMPDMMNCIDVLVLPSRNEGLPLVVMEALRCGANVVGADVGGIPEVAGKAYTVGFRKKYEGSVEYCGDEFVGKFAWKVTGLLNNPQLQELSPDFDWKRTAENELALIERTLEAAE